MKILMLIDRMESGGAETHVEALAQALCDGGDRVEVFSSGGRIADRMEEGGIHQRIIPFIGKSPWRFLLARRTLKKLLRAEKYDILHAHTRTMALLVQGLSGQGRRCGCIATVHAAFSKFPWLSRLAFRAEKTIAVSEDLRKRAIDVFNIPAESIEVIPNGVDCGTFYPPRILASHQTVLFASRLDEDCSLGAELLCDVMPRLIEDFPHIEISIAGGGSAMERIAELARRANEKSRARVGRDVIKMLGGVDDMASVYREHQIFVGASRAAMEAAACGCAVVLCGNEGRGGILTLERLLCDVDNLCSRGERLPDAAWLEGQIRFLLTNERIADVHADLCRAWVQKHRSVRVSAYLTRTVYGMLCDEKEGGCEKV